MRRQHRRAKPLMNPDTFDRAAAYMRDHWHLITDDESAYKRAYVAGIADVVGRADAGEVPWDAVLTADLKGANQLLGWRAGGQLLDLARAFPTGLAAGVRALIDTQNGDALWDALGDDAQREAALTAYPQLRGVGARATVASYFLFVHDPERWPMYRHDNIGTPLVKITGEPLDASSPATILWGYYRALDELMGRLKYAELPVTSRLDVQGVLWVVKYKKVV